MAERRANAPIEKSSVFSPASILADARVAPLEAQAEAARQSLRAAEKQLADEDRKFTQAKIQGRTTIAHTEDWEERARVLRQGVKDARARLVLLEGIGTPLALARVVAASDLSAAVRPELVRRVRRLLLALRETVAAREALCEFYSNLRRALAGEAADVPTIDLKGQTVQLLGGGLSQLEQAVLSFLPEALG